MCIKGSFSSHVPSYLFMHLNKHERKHPLCDVYKINAIPAVGFIKLGFTCKCKFDQPCSEILPSHACITLKMHMCIMCNGLLHNRNEEGAKFMLMVMYSIYCLCMYINFHDLLNNHFNVLLNVIHCCCMFSAVSCYWFTVHVSVFAYCVIYVCMINVLHILPIRGNICILFWLLWNSL